MASAGGASARAGARAGARARATSDITTAADNVAGAGGVGGGDSRGGSGGGHNGAVVAGVDITSLDWVGTSLDTGGGGRDRALLLVDGRLGLLVGSGLDASGDSQDSNGGGEVHFDRLSRSD